MGRSCQLRAEMPHLRAGEAHAIPSIFHIFILFVAKMLLIIISLIDCDLLNGKQIPGDECCGLIVNGEVS